MKLTFLSLLLFVFELAVSGQTTNDSMSVQFQLNRSIAIQQRDMDLKVIIKNISDKSILSYISLVHGSLNDNLSNFHIKIEQLQGGEYKPIWINQGVIIRDANSFDSLRHFDLNKRILQPNETDTIIFSLLNLYNFDKGKYRVKAFLRVNSIPNNQVYIDKNFESKPPIDQLIYLESEWMKIEVGRLIRRKRVGLE